MRELKVMTLGRQLSLVHSSKNSSASFQSPAFSQALIRLLYVITLRSHPCSRQPCVAPRACCSLPCPGTSLSFWPCQQPQASPAAAPQLYSVLELCYGSLLSKYNARPSRHKDL